MRIAIVGAFPFPLPQGSQVYCAEQAGALRAAGAEVALVVYGAGAGTAPARDVPVLRVPRLLSPARLASGPSPAKPVADLALASVLVRAHRRRPFDAVLAHNAEAAACALAARRWLRRPVVYVAHTLWRHELGAWAPAALARGGAPVLARLGGRLDAALARRADAVIALSRAAADALAPHARGPLAVIPPALAPAPEPTPDEVAAACARHRLAPGRFALYAGNLDRYQELDLLAAAAARLSAPVIVATHAARGLAPAPLHTVRVPDAETVRRLTFGAGVALLPRRAPGGFPVKLLNYLEARRAVVAWRAVADGLVHGESAWLLDGAAGPEDWVGAIETLLADPARAARLGAGGRAQLERAHRPEAMARATLDLLGQLCKGR